MRRGSPWLVGGLLALAAFAAFWSNESYATIARILMGGVIVTLRVTVIAFVAALALGTLLAFGLIARNRLVAGAARAYCEVIRGVPMLVLLFYIFFAITPVLVDLINVVLSPLISTGWIEPLRVRDIGFEARVIVALTIGYSAFIAEIVRGGLEAVGKGQVEAGKALGLSSWRRMRHVVLPQAFRVMLPPLGNDLVSMLKDSSLVSAVGVQDMTQLARQYTTSNFLFFETYTVLALFYLALTISLSAATRWLEERLKASEQH
jgi:polar amino acid transport system permease protein